MEGEARQVGLWADVAGTPEGMRERDSAVPRWCLRLRPAERVCGYQGGLRRRTGQLQASIYGGIRAVQERIGLRVLRLLR